MTFINYCNVYYIIVLSIQVLEILSSSPELLGLLHKVDAACHSRLVASSPSSDDVLKYVPSIREQLKVGRALLGLIWKQGGAKPNGGKAPYGELSD